MIKIRRRHIDSRPSRSAKRRFMRNLLCRATPPIACINTLKDEGEVTHGPNELFHIFDCLFYLTIDAFIGIYVAI